MLKTKPAVITDVGIDMQLRNLNGETIEFTKLVVGDGVYSDSESEPEFLRKMVSLKSPKQQFGVSSISMVDNEKIVASTVITNYELEEGYTIRELGLYARIKGDPESEGLVSLSLAEIEDTFPAYDGNVVSRIISRFQFSVSDSDTVQLSYLHDPVALVEDVDAKIAVLQKAIDDATALRASLEAYGMVKLCDSEAVTDSTGLALPVTEKNASIEGTLAYQISQLNTDLITTCFNRRQIADANTAISPGLNGLMDENTVNGVGVLAYCLCIGMASYSSLVQIAIGYRVYLESERYIWIRTRWNGGVEGNWTDWYKIALTT